MNATTPWHDPVVAEIHAAREQLADKYHNDLLTYSKAAETRCQTLGLTMAEDQHKTKTAPPSLGTAYPA